MKTPKPKQGRHPEKKLTPVAVRSKGPGRHTDGNGLYLVVDPSGARRWVLRTVVHGTRKDIGLGPTSLVSLAEAREKARTLRKVAREDGDPIAIRDKDKLAVPTFSEAARAVHKARAGSWKNEKHAAQWISTLETYAFPVIGTMRVNVIESPDILRVLAPIWLTKAETAKRVRQRMSAVFDWAKAAGHRSNGNPVEGIKNGLPDQPTQDEHHAALPYVQVPAFIKRLHSAPVGTSVRLAFEFLILTATRTNETLRAKLSEIDGNIWTIPKEKTKTKKREHRVPLSPRCLEIIIEAKAHAQALGSEYLFPGRKGPLSQMVLLMALRRMKVDVTAHGFRSSFRDWTSEETSFPRDVCEMALAHTIGDKTEAAYRRGDLFEKRRLLMAEWSEYVGGGK